MNKLPQHERMAALRILDANLNRATEGLRVIEEYARFALDDSGLSERCKSLRHRLILTLQAGKSGMDFLSARDTDGDVGCQIGTSTEYQRSSMVDVVQASFPRVQQALRSIEEYGKTLDPDLAREVEALRYETYTLQRQMLRSTSRTAQLQGARLYVLIDGGASETDFVAKANETIAAGVDVIQLRDKSLDDRTLLARAKALANLTRGTHTLFIMNDRPDLAALAHADGVHVGQEELPVSEVRKIIGPDLLIGVSTHNIEQARQAIADGADYIGCGPTFPSQTKSFDHYPGLDFLRQVAAEIKLPAFAIGGITLENVEEVLGTGVKRVAVSGAAASVSGLKRKLTPEFCEIASVGYNRAEGPGLPK
jgi:thiamine-phosphate pyrophosphorylase